MRHSRLLPLLAAAALPACGEGAPAGPPDGAAATACRGAAVAERIPLSEMGTRCYLGEFPGGLYPDGANVLPADHLAAGRAAAARIQPLDTAGRPDPRGKYVLISIGMSNTTQEFCSSGTGLRCDAWSFVGQALADPQVNHETLVLVNGARGGQTAAAWDGPADAEYDRIRREWLLPLGLSEKQVQAAWVKVANAQPRVSLPAAAADAYVLERQTGDIVRALRVRYPNLRQVFLSSRIYAGFATTALNPEPYAYESGFAAKWAIASQIEQMRGASGAGRAGDLRHDGPAPWLAWGPYLWAAGPRARADGLAWEQADFASDGTHPSQLGERKVGRLLLEFFKGSEVTRCWFLAGARCGG